MATIDVDGVTIAYDVIGDQGRPWVVMPGGRFDRHAQGVRQLAEALAVATNRVLIWDRPNTGASDVCFTGASEADMQADALAGLLRRLDMGPAVVMGGSSGARTALLAAHLHPDAVAGLALLWISGGPWGLLTIATHYCARSIEAAWHGGMEAVVALPEWAEVQANNPGNRSRFLQQEPARFVEVMERWMLAYCPRPGEIVPGLTDEAARRIAAPALVLRSGTSDLHHPRAVSERLASLLGRSTIVDPPWGDGEWNERARARAEGDGDVLFARWPMLAPTLLQWAEFALAL